MEQQIQSYANEPRNELLLGETKPRRDPRMIMECSSNFIKTLFDISFNT